jgi:hypothetical protein
LAPTDAVWLVSAFWSHGMLAPVVQASTAPSRQRHAEWRKAETGALAGACTARISDLTIQSGTAGPA